MSKPQSRGAAAGTILVAALLLAAGPAQADKCTSLKLKAIGKMEAGLLTCQSKVAQQGDTSILTACEKKVVPKFTASFGKSGTCTGVQADSETIAND